MTSYTRRGLIGHAKYCNTSVVRAGHERGVRPVNGRYRRQRRPVRPFTKAEPDCGIIQRTTDLIFQKNKLVASSEFQKPLRAVIVVVEVEKVRIRILHHP